jgi:hypothetical protein
VRCVRRTKERSEEKKSVAWRRSGSTGERALEEERCVRRTEERSEEEKSVAWRRSAALL